MTALERLDTQNAQLPRSYSAARQALEQAHAIDECKRWADKATALDSYARQAKDDALQKIAMRIQGRAVRRAGELLREIEPSRGNHWESRRDDTDLSISRKAAADAAGLSELQRKTAIRVAGVPEDEFDARIESDNPPTADGWVQDAAEVLPPQQGKGNADEEMPAAV